MRLTFVAALAVCARAQVIQFESGGLKYQTLSRKGLTIMFAHLPAHLRDYQILQVGISNGSGALVVVRPEDFIFERQDGTRDYATPARTVVDQMLDRATRNDVIRLISTYENTLNGVTRFRSTNGYEARRQSFLAESGSARLRAAAAASAIAFVETRLKPGESTDGAVFFYTAGKPLGPGRLLARASGQMFEFEAEPAPSTKTLQQRPQEPAGP
ncbi:MAG: hypothetical protein ACM336_06645 [Acidobacteriota bacterium]